MIFPQSSNITKKFARGGRLVGLLQNREASAAIEFAVVAPIFAFVLVASVDLGMLNFSRFKLEAAVSASASYALAHADQVDSNNGDELAKNLAFMIASNHGGDATAFIEINNGSQANYDGATIKIGGAANRADSCYCPTGAASSVGWGTPLTCGTQCPDGGRAGRYVSISARQEYTPFFSMFDAVKDGLMTASAIVQTR